MSRKEFSTPENSSGGSQKDRRQRPRGGAQETTGELFEKDVPEQTPRRLSYTIKGRDQEIPTVIDATTEGEMRAEADFARTKLKERLNTVTEPYVTMIRELAVDIELERRRNERESRDEEPRREKRLPGAQLIKRFLHKEEEPEPVIITKEIQLLDQRTDRSFPTQTTYRIEEGPYGFNAIPLSYKQRLDYGYEFEKSQPQLALTFGDTEEIDAADITFRIERRQDSLGRRENQIYLPSELLAKITKLYPEAVERLREAPLPKQETDLAVLSLRFGESTQAEISYQAHPEFLLPGDDLNRIDDYKIYLDATYQYTLKGPTEEEQQRLTDLTKEVFGLIPAQ